MNPLVSKHYNPKILAKACALYGIAAEDAKLIRDNSNFIFDCKDKILRLSHSEIRSSHDIEVELDWLLYLSSNELDVVNVIPSVASNLFEVIGQKAHFTVVCFDKIVGTRPTSKNWNASLFQSLGEITGKLHRVGNEYKENPSLNYLHWDQIAEADGYLFLPDDKRNLQSIYNNLIEIFSSYRVDESNYGFIHYDIHHGNYLIDNKNKIKLLDFEMVCKSWFINDIATILFYAFQHEASPTIDDFENLFMQAFWSGYEKEFHLDSSEKEKIPAFLLYRNLMVYGYLYKIWNMNKLNPEQAAYIQKLEVSLKKRVATFQ